MKAKKSIPKIDKTLIKSPNHFPVVGIGASAGGLDAFKQLLKAIPDNSGMAYVLVQHLDPSHESLLVELLQKVTSIPVLEIADDIKVQPDHIYIIPSNKMMIANDGVLELSPRPAKNKNERNLPIDLFFNSLAEVHQSHAIGIVLSGTASDGTMGLKAIKDHGGITFAQDEESAQYEGMPHSAMEAGVVDFILPPDKIPQKLLEVTKITNGHAIDEENMPQQDEDVFKQIISLLRIRKGTDFTYYKQSTIRRRILRRMAINKTEEPVAYLKYLRDKKPEQDLLYQDLLIPVTEFFRDPKIFENLCKSVFPLIVKNKTAGELIRVWVAGCSTGQEVYSIAICLKELLGDRFSPEGYQKVQIFATDISEPAIAKARTGIYSKSDVKGLSEEHLKEYFTKTNGDYQAKKSIRDLCVFAVHNFLKDPAFSKMDFISCRNVLIYMEPYLQKKALTTFHYALNPKGFLLLGKSETTGGVPDLFALNQLKGSAKTDKLFIRKDVPGRFEHTANAKSEKSFADINVSSKSEIIRTDFQKTADDIMLSKYTPAGVVVNETMDIVHFRGSTGMFLEPSPGKASLNLLKMAKEGLAFELRNILHKAKKENTIVLKENIPIQVNGVQHNIAIEAMPLPNIIEPHYLVLFHQNKPLAVSHEPIAKTSKLNAQRSTLADKSRIVQLEKELAQSREDMRSITEDQEAANEELQSANEELLSGSEELQSLNEEMETSKEELQSTNEELTVVNQEMIGLNEQVTKSRDYAEAIISNLHEPLLVLDKNLRIKTANSSFYKIFQVHEKDTEGKLIYDLGNRQWNIPALRTLLEDILPHKSMFENFEVSHNFPNIGERIVLLNAREIVNETGSEKLILLALEDITEQVTARKKIEESEQRFRNLVEQSMYPILILKGEDMILDIANEPLYKIWGVGKEALGKPFLKILPEMKDQPFMGMLLNVLHNHTTQFGKEQPAHFVRANGEKETVYFNFVYQPYTEKDGAVSGVIVFANDVTEQVLAHKKVEESEQQLRKTTEHFEIATTAAEVGTWSLDLATQTLEWSGLHKKIWGYDENRTDLVYEDWHKMILAEDKETAFAGVTKALAINTPYEISYRIKPDGKEEVRWIKSSGKYLYNDAGEAVTLSGVSIDITEQKQTQSQLEYSKALLEAHNEASVDGILLVDTKGKILSYNHKFIQIWNMPKQIVEAKHDDAALAFAMAQLVTPEQFIEKVNYLYNHPKEISIDELEFKDGKIVERHGYPVVSEDGSYYAWSWTFRDITELKKVEQALQKSEEHFRLMADLMPAKISNASVDGEVTYFNKHWLDFSGFSFEELRDFGYHQIMHPDEIEEFQIRFQKAAATLTDLVMEMRFKNKAGEYVWHLNIASPVKDENGNHKMWVGVTTDISEQIKIRNIDLQIYETHAKELREAKEMAELATAIAEAAKNNAEKAATIAEEAVKSKQQFLSNMSHEIRTPMNAIIGFSKVVLKTDLTKKQKEYLNAIKVSGDALIVLINDILDLAKVDSGKMTFEQTPFKLADSVTAMLHLFEPKVQEKNITFVKEYDNKIPEVLLGDPVRLHQVILNLVGNAVKFTNQGKITVSVNLLNEDEEKVTIAFAVTDTGIGIPQDKLASIFENFQQASSDTTRLYGGTGLGLAISKQLVQMQGGSLTVESKVGEGAVFSFTLSFKKTTARVEAAAEIIKIAAQIKNINVLVVEDVALNQLLIRTLLEDFGFDCDICANGKIAIEKLQANSYDIVLMDLQMPEMNGFEATEYIRHTMHSAIPIIALTADVTTADVAKCKAVGMNDYISKPVDEKLLYSKIIKLMEKPETVKEIVAAIKYTNLAYLQKHTKSNPTLMMEMITLYLEQTPSLINTIKQSLQDKNWEMLNAAVHKMIPSFSIVGMSPDFTAMAKQIQQYSIALEVNDEVHDLVLQLEKACGQACIEMEEAYNNIKNTKS